VFCCSESLCEKIVSPFLALKNLKVFGAPENHKSFLRKEKPDVPKEN